MTKDPKGRNKPLTCKVSRGVLRIEIGVETLAFAALRAPFLVEDGEIEEGRYSISNADEFAVEVAGALEAEEEDGTTPLHLLIDKACEDAINDGSLYFEDKENPA